MKSEIKKLVPEYEPYLNELKTTHPWGRATRLCLTNYGATKRVELAFSPRHVSVDEMRWTVCPPLTDHMKVHLILLAMA